jgi:hypothetical protein
MQFENRKISFYPLSLGASNIILLQRAIGTTVPISQPLVQRPSAIRQFTYVHNLNMCSKMETEKQLYSTQPITEAFVHSRFLLVQKTPTSFY